MYVVKKTWSQERGPSVCFRNWRAAGHCRYLHGYALGITIEFGCDTLDDRHWTVDFGGMKDLKEAIDDTFDHATIVQADDPERMTFEQMNECGLIQLRIMPQVSVEGFAKFIYFMAESWLEQNRDIDDRRVRLLSVTVNEHTGNEANYAETIWLGSPV